MRIYFALIVLLTLSGCNNDDINNASKRNEKWGWFVDKATGKGGWVKVGERMNVPDGTYTLFYSNGHIRETGKVIDKEYVDTTDIYDLNGQLSKLIIRQADSTVFYYCNNGVYADYSPVGEPIMKGMVKDHELVDATWLNSGQDHFLQIYIALGNANANNEFEVLKRLILSMKAESSEEKPLSPVQRYTVDSVYTNVKLLTDQSIFSISKVADFEKMPDFKRSILELITQHQFLLNNGMKEVITLFEDGTLSKNLRSVEELQSKYDEVEQAEMNFRKTKDDFYEKYPLTEEQIQYLHRKVKITSPTD